MQHSGQPPNANATPLVDPDGDGQNNAFEFTAGLIPQPKPAPSSACASKKSPPQPGQKNVIFSPRFTDRTYTVKAKPSLLTGTSKFYQVEITTPSPGGCAPGPRSEAVTFHFALQRRSWIPSAQG